MSVCLPSHSSAGRSKLLGHTKPVEEVVFRPASTQELASVGDDSAVSEGWWLDSNGAVLRVSLQARALKNLSDLTLGYLPPQISQWALFCLLGDTCLGAQDTMQP